MLNLTNADLAKKTDAQLAALFQQATRDLTDARKSTAQAHSHVAVIRAEMARRGPAPSA